MTIAERHRELDALHEAAHAVTGERLAPGCSLDILLDVAETGAPKYGKAAFSADAIYGWRADILTGEDRAVMARASRFIDPRVHSFVEDDEQFRRWSWPERRGTLAAKALRIVTRDKALIYAVAKVALVTGSLSGRSIRRVIELHDRGLA